MKRTHAILLSVALASLVFVSAAYAQEEGLTLEGLDEGLDVAMQSIGQLAEQVTALVARVDAVEEAIAPPTISSGTCVLHLSSSPLQRETLTKYIDQFDTEPENLMTLKGIYYNEELNLTMLRFEEAWKDRTVAEWWNNCEYKGSTDWVED